MVLRSLKEAGLHTVKSLGAFTYASNSNSRNSRLLVLGYHGVALDDEHIWDPELYISPDSLRRHLEALRRNKCTVLSLEDALACVTNGDLPERATALTFDDGSYDFYKIAWPILKEFGYPVTLYLTTYYCEHQYPVPPGIWRYLLWNARSAKFNACLLFGKDVLFDLSDESGRAKALTQIWSWVKSENMDGHQKNEFTAKLAEILDVDFAALCRNRILHLVSRAEVRELARQGVSVQMHTHRHSNPVERRAFLEDVQLSRERIAAMTGSEPGHFCYPDGIYTKECADWLRDFGIKSATTCEVGLYGHDKDPMLIPRLIVTSSITDIDFESWLVGIGAVISHYRRV
jgi:peptidoglycan/xylan/chitin deacetylase (PgdA/CDA1 family)